MPEVSNQRPPADSIAVVVVAHGSRAPAANDAHRDLVARLGDRSPWTLSAAFLELAEPSIPDAIDAAASADLVLVLPYFLHPGRHLTEDIPALVTAAEGRHGDTTIRLLGAFGSEPGVLDLLAEQVERATTALG